MHILLQLRTAAQVIHVAHGPFVLHIDFYVPKIEDQIKDFVLICESVSLSPDLGQIFWKVL